MSNYGHFNERGNEYIFADSNARRYQMNYMWNSKFLSAVNHFGGGKGSYQNTAAFYIDSQNRGRGQLIKDGNRCLYVKDESTNKVWAPSGYPVREKTDFYQCTHGIGYTIINGKKDGIDIKWRIFVGTDEPAEIWTITVKNESNEAKNIKLYPFVEISLEGYQRKNGYDSWVRAYHFDEYNLLYAINPDDAKPHDWYNGFMATDYQINGFDTSRDSFLGQFGSVDLPDAIVRGMGNIDAACEEMVLAYEQSVCLEPYQEFEYNVILGISNSKDTAKRIADKLLKKGCIDNQFQELLNKNKKIEDMSVIHTPNQKVNNFSNYWLKQQTTLCAEIGRGAGKGFRDQLQDSWSIAAFNPDFAKQKIYETLQNIYKSGRCVRGWQPLNDRNASDSPTWIAPTINAYLKETGDYGFLQEKVSYLDGGEDTVWEHMLTTARCSSDDIGERNLVKMHSSDWCDSLSGMGAGGRGESVWTSIALYNALNEMIEIAQHIIKDNKVIVELKERAEIISKVVNTAGWDGKWYLQGYTDDGEKVGSNENEEGKIFLNSQTWAIISGITTEERKQMCLEAIDKYLDSENGPLTLYPTFTKYKPEIGRITGFVPGKTENGTPYCHACAFKIVMDCLVGRSEKAYEALLKIMPDSVHNPSEYSGAEPYVMTNQYFGTDNPRAGQTRISWITGTAGWVYRAITEYMFGFRAGYNSIKIAPCIPKEWDKVTFKRQFRNDIYSMTIYNEGKGTFELYVDEVKIEGNEFKIFNDKKEHKVIVHL